MHDPIIPIKFASTEYIAAVFADFAALYDETGFHCFERYNPSSPLFYGNDPDLFPEHFYLMSSIKAADNDFVIVSLGAAPGEWVILAAKAYAKAHPSGSFCSLSLEGDVHHCSMTSAMHSTQQLDPEQNKVLHAAAARIDGKAYFPIIKPGVDWGAGVASVAVSAHELDANIMMTEIAISDRIAANDGKTLAFQTIDAVSIPTILAEFDFVDFLHSDIQGAELEVFSEHITTLVRKVGICCIETHGADVEEHLHEIFTAQGCEELFSSPSTVNKDGRLTRDGHFIWRCRPS